jgi:nucleoside-diphosphate-sugar epimerase
MPSDALIGHTGFVGGTLLSQRGGFGALFHSSNSQDMRGEDFDLVVCAGAPGSKWIANQNSLQDDEKISSLIANLDFITCRRFILISTVDVFPETSGVDEEVPVPLENPEAYGRNRRRLESFVANRFTDSLIVRLPGLVGSGLRKNALFDLAQNNDVKKLNSLSRFQFYPMKNFWTDLKKADSLGAPVVHFTAEPLSVGEIARDCFGADLSSQVSGPMSSYDLRSQYASDFGGSGGYHYSAQQVKDSIREYAAEVNFGRS